jgi:hypothetical protein
MLREVGAELAAHERWLVVLFGILWLAGVDIVRDLPDLSGHLAQLDKLGGRLLRLPGRADAAVRDDWLESSKSACFAHVLTCSR